MNQQILMNFSKSPTGEDISLIANEQLKALPDELMDFFEELAIQVEEIPDEATESDLELEDPFELLALYKAGKDLAPGVEKKTVANDDDVLILYRRPILDAWCESGEDLTQIIRETMIEEIGTYFELPDDEIDELARRVY